MAFYSVAQRVYVMAASRVYSMVDELERPMAGRWAIVTDYLRAGRWVALKVEKLVAYSGFHWVA